MNETTHYHSALEGGTTIAEAPNKDCVCTVQLPGFMCEIIVEAA